MTKIAHLDMKSCEYVLPRDRAYGQARGLNFRRTCALFELTTDTGVVGYGEAGGPLKPICGYLDLVKPFFLGKSVFDFEIIAAEIYNRFYHFGVQNHLTACLGGISIAAVDAAGKCLKIPACDLLGGKAADAFPCYATTGYFTANDRHDYEPQLAAAKGKFAGVKIKVGASPASDLERVKLARDILGPDTLLMVDINGNYTVDIALESLRKIEPYNIHWCEEPLPPTDIRGYAELRARAPISIAASEAFCTVHDFARLIEARGVDIVQPSLTGCGGFGQAKAIAQLAQMNNLRVSPSVWGNPVALAAALHFSASLPVTPHTDNVPYPLIIEYDVGENPLRDKMLRQPLTVTDGLLTVPKGHGLGIDIDVSAIAGFEAK
jgi:D-galactarolactone cycloisomerase